MELDRSIYLAMQLRAWDQIDLSACILAIPIWVRNYGKEVSIAVHVARYWMRASCSLVNARTMQVSKYNYIRVNSNTIPVQRNDVDNTSRSMPSQSSLSIMVH